jgi:alpha-galactosidase
LSLPEYPSLPVEPRIVALHGRATSFVLEVTADGALLWRHWGARVDADGLHPVADGIAGATFAPDVAVPWAVVPTGGLGWFGAAGLVCHRDGQDGVLDLRVAELVERGGGVAVTLRDAVTRVAVDVDIALDSKSDCAAFSCSVINDGDAPLSLDWLASAMLPLPTASRHLLSFIGRYDSEFVGTVEPMPQHGWVREQRQGLTGHGGPPGLFVLGEGAGWHAGEVHAVQLAWSGNHRLAVEPDGDGGWVVAAGATLAPAEVVLAPGERHSAPQLLATCSTEGRNGAIGNFHAAIRARMDWPGGAMRPRPVQYNSWEGCYFDHDARRMMALVDRAAGLGIERFVLDDGWFAGRHHDRAGLGDWIADAGKYPDGLGPLAAHVVGLGMEFGLWIEPEMVNPDSDLYRAHPDWVLSAPGQRRPTARNQLVLDMGRAEVRDYLFDCIDALLSAMPIAYLKWDHNRALAPAVGGDGRSSGWRQVQGTYALIDRIRAAHPSVEIESCAAGGGRIDAGIAQRTHRFWASDTIDAVSRVAIQRGFLHFMPPELMGAHVGASPAHATGRSQSMDFRAAVALAGHFGVELDPGALGDADGAALAGWIARYKDLRDRMHGGRVRMGEGADGLVWQAHGDAGQWLVFVTRRDPPRFRSTPPLRLPLPEEWSVMDCELLHTTRGGRALSWPRQVRAMHHGPQRIDSGWVRAHGLPLPPMQAESVAIYSLTAIQRRIRRPR